MQDQVNNLITKGIKAIAITSKLTEDEIIVAFDNMQFGNIKFLYLSPEKLQSEFMQQKIKQLNVNLIAIDEVHCISEWGHDFRPSYLKISILKELKPNVNFIALTATATKKVTKDILINLDLEDVKYFKKTFYRKNLAYQLFKTNDILDKLKRILTKINKPSIIYVNSRKQTKTISNYLNLNNFKSSYYNGGLSITEKEVAFNNWLVEKTPIMVATNAFGMGIDKDNVGVVVHINLPNSIENYMQESGRVGRNGDKAFSVLLYNENTILEYKKRVNKNIIDKKQVAKIYKLINQHLYISLGELFDKKYIFNLQEFCTKYSLDILKTYNTIKVLEKEDILIFEENFNRKSNLQFCATNTIIINYAEKNSKLKPLIHLLLRSYGGVFDNRTMINEYHLAKKLQQTKNEIVSQLNYLTTDKIINYQRQVTQSNLQFLVMREDDKTINRIAKNIKARNILKKEKATTLLNYVTNNNVCRNVQLLTYFAEKNSTECGICDVCISKKKSKNDLKNIADNIHLLFQQKKKLSAKEIVLSLNDKEEFVLKTLQILLEKKILTLNEENKYEQR